MSRTAAAGRRAPRHRAEAHQGAEAVCAGRAAVRAEPRGTPRRAAAVRLIPGNQQSLRGGRHDLSGAGLLLVELVSRAIIVIVSETFHSI